MVDKSRGLRSSVVVDFDSGEDEWSNTSTSFKDLARYSMEYTLSCDADAKFSCCAFTRI